MTYQELLNQLQQLQWIGTNGLQIKIVDSERIISYFSPQVFDKKDESLMAVALADYLYDRGYDITLTRKFEGWFAKSESSNSDEEDSIGYVFGKQSQLKALLSLLINILEKRQGNSSKLRYS